MTNFVGVAPAPGATFNTQTPVISSTIYFDQPDTDYEWRVYVSTNPAPDLTNSNATGWVVNHQYTTPDYQPGSSVYNSFTATFQASRPDKPLAPGIYYFKVESVSTNVISGGPFTQSFVVQGPAIAAPNLPADGATLSWVDSANPYPFIASWNVVAALNGQSAYQLVVERVDTGAVVVDSGKVLSSATQASVNIPTTAKDIQLRWKVRIWNGYDEVSSYTATRTFFVGTPPTASITSPTQNQVLSTGTVNLGFTIGTSAGRTVNRYVAQLYKGLTKIWERTVTGAFANGATQTVTDTSFFMDNNTAYTYRLQLWDSAGIASVLYSRDFTVTYTPPATPSALTVSTSLYDISGYNSITWSGSAPDADFYAWEIEREDSMIDVSTGSVISTEPWKRIGVKYVNSSPTNEFRDYSAPSNYQVRYRVRQVAFKSNTIVNGDYSTSGNLLPVTTSYWLYAGVNGDSATMTAIPLHNVTGDSFSEEVEESEFVLLERGRYYERGTSLGVNGTLECKFRNTAGSSARVKRLALKNFKEANLFATLRNPFGDEYQVSLGSVQIGRVAGTGNNEFVDVSIPYKEVVNR